MKRILDFINLASLSLLFLIFVSCKKELTLGWNVEGVEWSVVNNYSPDNIKVTIIGDGHCIISADDKGGAVKIETPNLSSYSINFYDYEDNLIMSKPSGESFSLDYDWCNLNIEEDILSIDFPEIMELQKTDVLYIYVNGIFKAGAVRITRTN